MMHTRPSRLAVWACVFLAGMLWGTTILAQDAARETPQAAKNNTSDVKKDSPSEEPVDVAFTRVLLRGLNKVTARSSLLEVPIGTVTRFGTLEIIPMTCWKSAPEDQPENAALLEIWEIKKGESPAQVFNGWMFSSSPAISALEHPFYDITVVDCRTNDSPEDTQGGKEKTTSGKTEVKPDVSPEDDPDYQEPPPLD